MSETGYVLPLEDTVVHDAQVFPGLPGVFMPGVPVGISGMGIEEEEADRFISENEIPLQKTQVAVAQEPAPAPEPEPAPPEEPVEEASE